MLSDGGFRINHQAADLTAGSFFSLKVELERGAQAGLSCSLAVCLRRMPISVEYVWIKIIILGIQIIISLFRNNCCRKTLEVL